MWRIKEDDSIEKKREIGQINKIKSQKTKP